jgi:SPP1 gp7 family putative phage head morphogenesis protein
VTTADRIIESRGARFARGYYAAIHDLFVATVDGNRPAALDARDQLQATMAATMAAAELLGAREHLQHFAALDRRLARFAAEPSQTILPNVTFQEAVDAFVNRVPQVVQPAAVRLAQHVGELYKHGAVAFARAAETSVVRAAQQFIASAMREGIDEGEGGRRLAMTANELRRESAPWSEAYARMAFRTNVNTAVTAGRFRVARDQDLRAVLPAFEFDAVDDADTRPNHGAASGKVWSVENPVWGRLSPPLGYNCRCQVRAVSVVELEARGKLDRHDRVIEDPVPQDAHPDEGFVHGGRPDLHMVGR